MIRHSFMNGWQMQKEGEGQAWEPVLLPHDAMIHEKREKDGAGGSAHGFFPGGVYLYEKRFLAPEEWRGKNVFVEFEGIYRNSAVSLNGTEIGGRPYGYVPFLVSLDGNLQYGQENVLTVRADNSRLPNSRWYTGSGIYRPVHLLVGNPAHIRWHGIRITTLSCEPPVIRVEVETDAAPDHGALTAEIQVCDGEQVAAQVTAEPAAEPDGRKMTADLEIPAGKLWSAETPYLYSCRVTLKENGTAADQAEETFGIRKLTWNQNGFFVNGKETLLRGGCVHHDQGILGAAAWEKSEWRRVRIMKEAGFNAIRSSHNPASEAMLRACDAYGMYLMDETFDTWYNRKNKYDYGCDFNQWWEQDTAAMVERDYNHPSVILYSIGNEVAEPYEEKGVQAGQKMIDLIHRMDAARPVTCGTNLMILGRAAKGQGIYQDGETNTAAGKQKEKKEEKEEKNTSLAFNIMASFIGSGMNKAGNSKRVDEISSPFLDSLDIAGYNYASGRYPLEGKAHPGRIVFGSETFPQDIWKNWEMVKKYPYLIGDFMWTAWDYLGEAGLGAWSYTGGMPFNRPYPWLLSGSGVIDILGTPDASCRYAAVVWGVRKEPAIGVRPANHPGVRVSKSVWRGTNAIESWSWDGCAKNQTIVEVYGNGAFAELFQNGKSLGKKRLKECRALFRVKYLPGELKAVVFDSQGKALGETRLESAFGKRSLQIRPEEKSIREGEIVFVDIAIAGENGVVESNADTELACSVTGGRLLGFGSANPCTEERYDSGHFRTWYGRCMAVVYADHPGKMKVTVSGEQLCGEAEIEVVHK